MNLISANSRLFTQAELRLSTLMRECAAIINTLTEYELLILGSKHPTVLFTHQKPIFSLFTQKSNPNRRAHRLKTDLDQPQIKNLQHFLLCLDCQNNHYEVDY